MKKNYIKNYLFKELVPLFSSKFLFDDVKAALLVTLVAIPLSLSVALATGVPYETAIISAVVGGALGAIFGGSRLGVTGPAIAMSVLLASTIANYGFSGLLIVGLICGVLQIVSGVIRLGRIARFIPMSLILAFASGIGFLLLFRQLPHIFGINTQPDATVIDFIRDFHLYTHSGDIMDEILTVITIVILAMAPKFLPRSYAFVLGAIVPTLLVFFLHLHVDLVGNFSFSGLHVTTDHVITTESIKLLLITAIEVFVLASLETFLSTSAVDLMGKGDLHNPNQELIGQGIANIGVTLCGGIPVTGVVARSSINVLSGAKTRRAAIFQSVFILLALIYLPNVIAVIPTAVLYGILLAAAFKMLDIGQVKRLMRSGKLEFTIYIVTFLSIILFGINGMLVGVVLALGVMFYKILNAKSDIKLWTNNEILRVGITGNISFFSYDKLLKVREFIDDNENIKFVIFEFGMVHGLDSSITKQLIDMTVDFDKLGIKSIIHGASDEHLAIIRANRVRKSTFSITVNEYQIKEIIEKSGYSHSATDVLRHGITKYVSYYANDNQKLINTLAQGQKPHTLLITCSDSRLNPNAFFSANIGEIFIVRNVGNVVPPYMPDNIYSEIAAIEFSVSELGVRNIVICGHTECGAVKASYATGEDKLGYVGLDNWLGLIKEGFRKNKPKDAYDGVKVNLLHQVENLKTYPKIDAMIASGQITVNAWIYDVHSGHMLEWSDETKDFVEIV
ncbi:MAG: SulP family inorganic anion transporter [Burkholderiales bacterium]|nr:SulP family inorganic anion transporter [Burkholderiales bacterium]